MLAPPDFWTGIIAERACSPLEMERARRYLRALEEDMVSSSSSKDDFLRSATLARNMIEEAKVLSRALRPHDGLSYELLTLSPVLSLHELGMPSLCVRVLRSGNPAPVEVALWSFGTFQSRLNLMRRARHTNGGPAEADPWQELLHPRSNIRMPISTTSPASLFSREGTHVPQQCAWVGQPTPGVTVYRSPPGHVVPGMLNPQWSSFGASAHPSPGQAVSISTAYRVQPTLQSPTSSPHLAHRSVRSSDQASASPSTRYREI